MCKILFFIVIMLAAVAVSAQSLSVFNLDATNFPTMKAQFYAFDAGGNQQSPSISEITISENGIARNVLSITCPPSTPTRALSSVLVMDVSGSMAFGLGSSANIDIAKSAATTWINTLNLGQSECALTSFDDNSYFNQDFTTNKTKLQNAIAGLTPQQGTNYDAGLWQPPSGGLEVTKNAKHQRVIIFLTDGQPNFEPQTASIIAEAKQQNCLIYSVTVGLPCPQCLKDISSQTGGQWYENITTQTQIEEVYREILKQAQTGAPPCEITWQSASVCASTQTTAQFSWSGASATTSYYPPASSAAKLQCNPSYISIFPKQVGVKFDTIITIAAINAPFSVTNITSSNPAFDINPKIFSLAAGQSKTLTLSYTPADSSYAFTQFEIQTDQCSSTCYANGSFPGYKVAVPTLKIVKPNGGEQYIAGNDSDIIWTGIPAAQSVSLDYSIDAGNTWTAITGNASGGKYTWHVPNTPSNKCLVKASELSSGGGGGWAKRAGGMYQDNGSAVALDSNGNVYITGAFMGTADFSGITLVNQSTTFDDMFIAKYHSDGSIEWAKQVGAGGPDGGDAIAVDHSGNIYVTGIFGGAVNFSGISVTTANTEVFLAKYHPDGSVEWVKHWGAGGGDVSPGGIGIDGSGNIYTSGLFTNTLSMGPFTFTSAGQWDMYMTKLHPDGSFEWAKRVGSNGYDYAGPVVVDAAGNNYHTGFFNGSVDFDGTTLNSVGNNDIFVAKYRSDGNMDWVKRAGSTQYDQGYGIGIDGSGNVYVTGLIQGTSDFDGITLTGRGNNDIFIAKYHADGSIEWAKVEGGSGYDNSMSIAVLSNGSFYVTGGFEGTVNFDGNPQTSSSPSADIFVASGNADGSFNWVKHAGGSGIDDGYGIGVYNSQDVFVTGSFSTTADFGSGQLTEAGGSDVFLWKVGAGGTVASSDTSDAVFSIIAPQPLSEDVDMRKVFVSSMKDSIVQGFIRNGGTYAFRVDSIVIVGTDASQFGIVSGIPPYTIASGGMQQVEFHFAPKSIGIKTATIEIFTPSGTFTQKIQGEGIQQTIAVIGNVIDFGQVSIGAIKDTIVSVAIKNNGSTAVNFISSSQLGPDKLQFSLQAGNTPFTLAPGASQNLTLRFNPKFIGRTSGRIAFDYGGGASAVLNLFGQGVGGLVRIPDDSGYAGDHKSVPILLEKTPIQSIQSVATNFQTHVAYDKTILFPASGSIQHGARYDTLSISGALGTSDTLALLPFVAMLGDSKTSPMNIVDFTWLDGSGQPADYDAETESGTFYLLGICPAGGTRLFNPDGQVSMAHINPNPANGIINIDIQTIEKGRTVVEIQNLLGQKIATIYDGELSDGSHSFLWNAAGIAGGTYYLTLTTPTVRRMQRIEITK